jgi:hypothetical protein
MAKTVVMEDLPAVARQVIEEMLSKEQPVIVSLNGQPVGSFSGYPAGGTDSLALTDDEMRDIQAAIQRGDNDFAAGRYLTLAGFRSKYADRITEGTT